MAIFDRCIPRRDQQSIDVERRPPRMPEIKCCIVAPRTCLLPQPGDAALGNLGLAIRAIGMESRWLAIRATGMTNPNASVASTGMLQDVRGQPDHNNGRRWFRAQQVVRSSTRSRAGPRSTATEEVLSTHTTPSRSTSRRIAACTSACADQRVLFLHDMTVTQ